LEQRVTLRCLRETGVPFRASRVRAILTAEFILRSRIVVQAQTALLAIVAGLARLAQAGLGVAVGGIPGACALTIAERIPCPLAGVVGVAAAALTHVTRARLGRAAAFAGPQAFLSIAAVQHRLGRVVAVQVPAPALAIAAVPAAVVVRVADPAVTGFRPYVVAVQGCRGALEQGVAISILREAGIAFRTFGVRTILTAEQVVRSPLKADAKPTRFAIIFRFAWLAQRRFVSRAAVHFVPAAKTAAVAIVVPGPIAWILGRAALARTLVAGAEFRPGFAHPGFGTDLVVMTVVHFLSRIAAIWVPAPALAVAAIARVVDSRVTCPARANLRRTIRLVPRTKTLAVTDAVAAPLARVIDVATGGVALVARALGSLAYAGHAARLSHFAIPDLLLRVVAVRIPAAALAVATVAGAVPI